MAIEIAMPWKTGSLLLKIVLGLILLGAIIGYAPYKNRIAIFLVFLLLLGLGLKFGQGVYDRWLNPYIHSLQKHLLRTPLLYLLVFYAASHVPFVFSVFGEPDSVSIATGIIDSVKNSSYERLLDSPLIYNKAISFGYYLLMISMLKILHLSTSHLAELMNFFNVLIGMVLIIPLYKVLESLFEKELAFFTTVILSLTPSFWLSTTSGHPHLPAFFFFILALYLLDKAFQKNAFTVHYYAPALLSWVAALTMKADIILISPVFLGLLYWKRTTTRKDMIGMILFILLSTGLFFLLKSFLVGHDPNGGQPIDLFSISGQLFGRFFGITLDQSLPPVILGAGLATIILAILCCWYYWVKREYRLLIFLASWFIVPTFFWLLFIHNSARHNMMYVAPLIMIIVHYIHHHRKKYLLPLSALIILLNYFLVPPGGSSFNPSGRLWWDYVSYQEIVQKGYLTPPLQIARSPESRIFIIVIGYNPGYLYHLVGSMDRYQLETVMHRKNDQETIILQRIKDKEREFLFLNILSVNLLGNDPAITNKILHDMDILLGTLLKEDNTIRNFRFFVGSAPGTTQDKVAVAVRDHLERNGYPMLLTVSL